jgi:hypothetical protein
LQRLWSIDEENRKQKIAHFANENGFKLSFYKPGLCAIFERKSPGDSANGTSDRSIRSRCCQRNSNDARGHAANLSLVILLWSAKPAESRGMKYWEIIADNLSKAGWSYSCVSAWIPTSERSLGQVSISLRLSGVYHANIFCL